MASENDLVPITVTVPKDRASQLITYAASLHTTATASTTAPTLPEARVDDGDDVSRDALRAAGPGLTDEAVRRNYAGGESEYWRPFLKLLAHQPDQWVHWPELYNAIGLKNPRRRGCFGAAERRCKGYPPYVKAKEDGEHYFWMPKDVAELIVELATD